jgi:TolB-like protein/class 3 adenylate cyclase/Flp pilus assembly protein TadD
LSGERVERRLAAILAADVVGYSRLMGQDEAGTLARLRTHRDDLIDPTIAEHKGRIVKTTGDGILIEFPSVVEAVACAVAVQQGMTERNVSAPEDQRIVFRVGVNLGDIIIAEDDDIHGDGVNVAARLEGIAEPGAICISGTVRDHIGDRLDLMFEDMGEQSLKNIARPVRVYRVRQGNDERAPSASLVETTPILALPDKPSIAVLPFQNMSSDPEQEYFADGMVEEIITTLSRIRWLFVIARNSSFTYKGQAVDVKQVGRELGVRYLLEGSVRKTAGRVRITAQLIEAATGTHLWANRFDGSLEDVFELQDQIAISVAGVIEPAIEEAESRRSTERPTRDLTAYDLFLRGTSFARAWTKDATLHAIDLVERAIACDPDYGPALALAGFAHMQLVRGGWSNDPEADSHKALELARRALQVAGENIFVLVQSAGVLGNLGQDIDTAIATVDHALLLSPSYAGGWFWSGYIRLFAGFPDLAIEHFQTSLRLDPRTPLRPFHLTGTGMAHFFNKDFCQAAADLLASLQQRPSYPTTSRFLAACYAHMGRLEEARGIVARLRAITPEVVPNLSYLRDPEHRELLLSGLRLAAGETE